MRHDDDTAYFEAAGRSLAAVESINAKRQSVGKDRMEFARRLGCDGLWAGSSNLVGVVAAAGTKCPDGMKAGKDGLRGKCLFVPDRRGKRGRELAREMAKLSMPGAAEFSSAIGLDLMVCYRDGQTFVRWAVYEKFGDTVVIAVPIGENGKVRTPPDAKPLKTSEFWALKEKHPEPVASAA